MAVKVGPIIIGKLKVNDVMIGTKWKGMQIFKNTTARPIKRATPEFCFVKIKTAELSHYYRYKLTREEKDEWEVYAKKLTSASREISNRLISNAKNIIRKKNKLMSGFNAYISSNIIAYTRGFSIPKNHAPISTPAPCSPLNVTITINNGIAKISWEDPPIYMFEPHSNIVVTIFVQLYARKSISARIYGVLKVPSEQTFQIENIKCNINMSEVEIPLKRFIGYYLRVQMNTAVSEGENIGAVLSPPSNVATAQIT